MKRHKYTIKLGNLINRLNELCERYGPDIKVVIRDTAEKDYSMFMVDKDEYIDEDKDDVIILWIEERGSINDPKSSEK